MKLKKLNCEKTLKTQIVMRLINSKKDKTQKLKLWPNSNCDNSIAQNVTKLKNSYCDKTFIKLWQNFYQIVTKLKIWQISICEKKNKFKKIFK